ncbi:MFS transporter [Microbacteriaceae bacterium VKM Ac-2855]|nr:MFS transporter [Microbacteriaceae bacterium VKM Ac-2855]
MTFIEQSYPNTAGARLYPRLAVLAGGLFVVGTNAFVIAGLLPSIARSLAVTPSAVSLSITSYSLVVAVVAPALSILLPRLSRTTLMASGLALVALGTLITASASDLGLFTVGRVVAALGGAALVPPATAAAASLAPAAQRGRAIAFVGVGFTAATAFGAPVGTALAADGGWREPLLLLAALAAVLAVVIALVIRNVPIGDPVSLRRRLGVLREGRILTVLGATALTLAGFNAVYIFSSAITAGATGGDGAGLAVLLLIFGVSGIVGTVLAGPSTDRFGNRVSAVVFLGGQALILAALPLVATSFAGSAVLFALWGVTASGAALPLQHRLVAIDPGAAGITLSWYSTAMYAGIALAPILGATALAAAGPEAVPLVAAAAAALALLLFVSFTLRRSGRDAR